MPATGPCTLAATQVAQMVQAMAALGAPGGIDGGWIEEQRGLSWPPKV
ncbi:MAG: hypothetical protein LBP33_04510 [Candidatus Adiutrix sp.]|nr:hypothetical protein [Candidatus Adiutrix sp.]